MPVLIAPGRTRMKRPELGRSDLNASTAWDAAILTMGKAIMKKYMVVLVREMLMLLREEKN